jgi:glutamate formiminotransferase
MIVECVPNFSEGRRPVVLDALAASIRAVAGIRLLDVSADPDHNRSVFTFVGASAAVLDAALRSAAVAVERIDLRAHRGVHPRIGAVDVIPIVPLVEGAMPECVALARRLGGVLAERLALPVFFYGQAGPRTLAQVRRGGFERLRGAIDEPERAPDLGPERVHPTAGAVAVGARDVLIAFNVDLHSPDVAAAREIARAVRESSGGLPAVQAMGVFLQTRGVAQVSMNLLDYRRTPPLAAFQRVEAEAARRGLTVEAGELVGCAPREALPARPVAALRLRGLRPGQLFDPLRMVQGLDGSPDAGAHGP